jgi:hypothetical protein
MYAAIFSRWIKILSWRGVQIRYCGYWFKQLILSVFYIPDKISVISPKQRMSNHCTAISEAAEHATELGCCKSIQVKQCSTVKEVCS